MKSKRIITLLLITVLSISLPAPIKKVNASQVKKINASKVKKVNAGQSKKLKKIVLNKKTIKLMVGKRTNLKVKIVKPSKESKKVRWSSSNKKIAEVSKKGVVIAKKKGIAVIKATSKRNKKVSAKCRIKVMANKKLKKKEEDQIIDTIYDGNMPESYNPVLKSISHRGYNKVAPENTLSAFRLSKKMGYFYVETDIHFTADQVPVCLHDDTVDRTSNGTGSINDMTFDKARQLDFGMWKSKEYQGEKIPSFEEFVKMCKNLSIHPYIEINDKEIDSEEPIKKLLDIVKKNGMRWKITWISAKISYLKVIKELDPSARLGYVVKDVTDKKIKLTRDLKTELNNVFLDAESDLLTDEIVDKCSKAEVPLEVWTVNNVDEILMLNPYINGITSDMLIAQNVIIDNVYNKGYLKKK